MTQTMTLTKEEWKNVADNVARLGQIFQQIMTNIDLDGKGQEYAQECEGDIIFAVTAINYVAEYAADKCVFVRA